MTATTVECVRCDAPADTTLNGSPMCDTCLHELEAEQQRVAATLPHHYRAEATEDTGPAGTLDPQHWGDAIRAGLRSTTQAAIPLPFPTLTEALDGGLRAGEVWLVGGWTSHGKALDVTTPVPTPNGWKTMGDLKTGDFVFGADGIPTQIARAHPVLLNEPCYEVAFSDGSAIITHGGHLWRVYSHASRRSEVFAGRRAARTTAPPTQAHKRAMPEVVTTNELARRLASDDPLEARSPSIPCAGPLQYTEALLPVDPYVLGAWLGDGDTLSAAITTVDSEILDEIRAAGHKVRPHTDPIHFGISGLQHHLRALGVLGYKFIPGAYLDAAPAQRFALLQGLMDTDGTVSTRGKCEFAVCNRNLAHDALELCLGLGLRATLTERAAKLNGREVGRSYRVGFVTDQPVCRLQRKLERLPRKVGHKATHRYIRSVRPVPTRPVRCITVAAPDRLFLVGRACIATHNTLLVDQMADTAADAGSSVHLYLTEMTAYQRGLRLLARRTGVSFRQLKRRSLTMDQWRLVEQETAMLPYGLSIVNDWTPDQVITHIRRNTWDLAVIDLLHGFHYRDERDLSQISGAFARAARGVEHQCVVVSAVHLNEAQMQGQRSVRRPRPGLHSIKGASSLKQDATGVLFVWQEDDEEGRPTGDGAVWAAKSRDSGLAGVSVVLNPVRMVFEEAP